MHRGHRVAPSPPGSSPYAAASRAPRPPALEADLEQLNAKSRQLAAENHRLKQLVVDRENDITRISESVRRATSAAEISRERSESDQAEIRRLRAELAARSAAPAPQSPSPMTHGSDPPITPGSPAQQHAEVMTVPAQQHADMMTELRLLRSEMEDAKRARHTPAPVPFDYGALVSPGASAAPPVSEKSAREVTLLEELLAVKQELAKSQQQLALERHNLEKSQVDEASLRRRIVEEMGDDWGALSDVIRSTLLQKTVSSPGAKKALDAAAAAAAAASDKTDQVAGGSGQQEGAAEEAGDSGNVNPNEDLGFSRDWSGDDWVASLGVHKLISSVLVARAGRHSHLIFVRTLAADELLRVGFLEKLTDLLWEGMCQLLRSTAATAEAMHSKFVAEGDCFILTYGGIDAFFGGLENLVGPPNPNLEEQLEREHTSMADSTMLFRTTNYGIDTRSDLEFYFVADPDKGRALATREAFVSNAGSERDRWWPTSNSGSGDRKPLQDGAKIEFEAKRRDINADLLANECAALCDAEVWAGRLYTGPMFQKYNLVLRGVKAEPESRVSTSLRKLTRGNTYTTTLHCINSIIVKLGKLTKAQKVYRGISGGVLPDEFWTKNEYNVCGGVEFAFTSTTTNQEVALRYASSGKVGMVFEIQMGMVDRGAELEWLSQYPGESEICFAPLTGVEVQKTRVENSMLIVEARLSVNLTAMTIEQVIAKMQRSQLQLLSTMVDELSFAGAPRPALAPLTALRSELSKRDPSYFNDAENFKESTTEALNVQREVFLLLAEEASWEEDDAGEAAAGAMQELRVEVTELSLLDKETPRLAVNVIAGLLAEAEQCSEPLELRRNGGEGSLEAQNIKGVEFLYPVGASTALMASLRDAVVSHDDRGKGELRLKLSPAAGTMSATQLGIVRVDLATLLGSREQELDLRVMDETVGVRAVQVGRAAISVRVPDAAFKISLQMHTAARMQAVAALCARAGQPKEAKALLELAHKRRPLGPPIATRRLSVRDLAVPAAADTEENASWQLPAAEMLLRSGDTAWPSTLVALSDGVEQAFARRALETRQAEGDRKFDPFSEGSMVLYRTGGGGFSYGKIVRKPTLSEGFGWYEFARNSRQPSYSVFAVSSSGVGAVLREAAAAGRVNLINELLLGGVSPFESDAQATTALHRAAAEGREEVCRRLCIAGAVGSAPNMQNQTPLDLAVRSKHVRCRRVFEPSASDKDVTDFEKYNAALSKTGSAAAVRSPTREPSQGERASYSPGSRSNAFEPTELDKAWAAASGVVAQSLRISPLMIAARAGELERVKTLIREDGVGNVWTSTKGLHERSQRRCTALLMAAEEGHTEVVTLLFETAAADAKKLVADADADGCTALHLAAGNGHLQTVEKLLMHNAAVDRLTKKGASPLLIAAKHGYTDVVEVLLDANASIAVSDEQAPLPLVVAAQSGMESTVKVLLPKTMEALEKDKAQTKISQALTASASSGHAKVTRVLLRATTNKSPQALLHPLEEAISGDHEAAARMLIAAGSSLRRMLRTAAQGRLQCVKALLEVARSDAPLIRRQQVIDDVPGAMRTAMKASGHDAVAVELLAACIEHKCDVSQYLTEAAAGGRTELVHALLNAGAKDAREQHTTTALMRACSNALPEVVRILLRSGTPPSAVEIRDENGATALCYAAGFSYEAWSEANCVPKDEEARRECVQLLLEASSGNYVSANGESSVLHLQQGKAALAMATLAGFDQIAGCLERAWRDEQVRASVKQKFKVTKLQQGVLAGLSALQETAQEEAVKRVLEERTGELRQWLQDHEEKALELWSHTGDDAADASPAAPMEVDLVNVAFAHQLMRLQRVKEDYERREREKKKWREAEASNQDRCKGVRRLRGEPQQSPPVVCVRDTLKLLFKAEAQASSTSVMTIGCPAMLQHSGVLLFEVEFEVEFPSGSSYWGPSAIGFASCHFDTGDQLKAGVGDGEDSPFPTSWRAHNEEAAWNVGDVACFAANVDLGWIAICKAGNWSDPASRVVAVDDAIKKGVFPVLSAGFGSVLFRVQDECTTQKPPESFWSRQDQLEKAFLAQDKKVTAALAITEDEHASLKARLTGVKAQKSTEGEQPRSDMEPVELIERLNHLDGAVRGAAIGVLGQLEAAAQSKHVVKIVTLIRESTDKAHARQAALAALAKLDRSLSMDHLAVAVASLADPAHNVRMAALTMLMGLPPNTIAPHTADIVVHLHSKEGRVPRVCLKLLAKLPGEALAQHCVQAVVEVLRRSMGADTQEAAFEVLKALRPDDLIAAASSFVPELLESADSSMRVATIRLLASHMDAIALSRYGSALVLGLRDPDPQVRSEAADALVKLVKTADGISDVIAGELVDTLAVTDAGARTAALDALKKMVPLTAGKTITKPLLTLLNQPQSAGCGAALEVLSKLNPLSEVSPDLVMRCFAAGSTMVQASALEVLAKFEPSKLARLAADLAARLGSEEWRIPSQVVDVLCKLRPNELAEHQLSLIKSVKHTACTVRAAALHALGSLPPAGLEASAPQIIEAALKDADASVREAALGVLANVPPRALNQHAPLLASSVNHEQLSVRSAAVQGLAKLEPSALAPHGNILVTRLADDDSSVRNVASRAFARLPRMSRKELAPRVVAHLTHRDKGVRSAALEACDLLDHTALDLADAEQTLAAAANHEEAQVREAAMDALASLGRLKPRKLERFLVVALKRLRDDEPTVRAAALRVVARLPLPTLQGDEVVKAVMRRLEDSEGVVRDAAEGVFGGFLPAALERLKDRLVSLLSHADQATRRSAANVLGRLPAATLDSLYNKLVAILDDDAGRAVARDVLLKLSASTLAPLCDKLVRMVDGEKRQEVAIMLLSRVDSALKDKHAGAIVELISERNAQRKSTYDLLELLSQCGSSAIKANARVLGTLKLLEGEQGRILKLLSGARRKDNALLEAMIQHIVLCLQDKSWYARQKAIEVLGRLRDGAFRAQLPTILGMLNDEDEYPRSQVLDSLTQLSANELKELMPTLNRTLDDPTDMVRTAAVRLISKRLDPTTLDGLVTKLLEMLKDVANYGLEDYTIRALSRLEPAALSKHAAAVVSALQGLTDAQKRSVSKALEKQPLRNDKLAELLLKWASSRANAYAPAAIRAIGALGPEEAHRSLLLAALQQSDAQQGMEAAVWALHRLPAAELQQYEAQFVALLSSESSGVRRAGVMVLAKHGLKGVAEHATALVPLLAPGGDKGVQASVLEVLAKMGPTALATLEQPIIALVAPGVDQDVQLGALKTLIRHGSTALAALEQPIAKLLAPDSDKKADTLRVLAKMDPAALTSFEQSIVALVDEQHPAEVSSAALEVMAAFAPSALEAHRHMLFELIDVVQDVNGAALQAIAALQPPPNCEFAWQLAALTEHFRCGRRYYMFKALLSLSRAQLSFCVQLVMTTLSRPTGSYNSSEETSSAVLVLGFIWLGKTLDVPKAPEK